MARRPFDGAVNITQEYGTPEEGSRRGYHTGVDYGMGEGTPVLSPTNGTLHQNGDGRAASDGRGWFVTLVGDDGIGHCLYHLNRNSIVPNGVRVTEGQLVGYSGNTGLSTGPHLHWETRKDVDNNTTDFAPGSWLFAGQPVVTPPAPAPAPATTQYVRFFGDYRTGRNVPGGAAACTIRPSQFDGHLDYPIKDRSGDWVQVTTSMYGDKWFYVGPDQGAASLTQFYNA